VFFKHIMCRMLSTVAYKRHIWCCNMKEICQRPFCTEIGSIGLPRLVSSISSKRECSDIGLFYFSILSSNQQWQSTEESQKHWQKPQAFPHPFIIHYQTPAPFMLSYWCQNPMSMWHQCWQSNKSKQTFSSADWCASPCVHSTPWLSDAVVEQVDLSLC